MGLMDYIIAARLPAYPIIGFPIFIGAFFAKHILLSSVSWEKQFFLHLNGILLMAHILFLNDYGDEETDKLNTNYFNSGGSRVIVDGRLNGSQLYYAAILVAKLEIVVALYTMFKYDLTYMPLFAIVGCSFGWFYSIHPFRLCYKGFGEIVQGISLGLFLPMMGYYVASGTIADYPYYTVLILLPVFYSSNIVHALPDYPSDKLSNKITHVVLFGEFASRKHIMMSYLISTAFAVYFAPHKDNQLPYALLLLFDVSILAVVFWFKLFHTADILNANNKGKNCHMFVRLNMFAMLGHITVWLIVWNMTF